MRESSEETMRTKNSFFSDSTPSELAKKRRIEKKYKNKKFRHGGRSSKIASSQPYPAKIKRS